MSRKEYNAMTMETEMSPPATESNGGDGSDATITCASETSKSNSSNGGQGCGQGVCTGRCSHQGRGGRGGRFNRPAYTSLIRNFKVEVEYSGTVLGTTFEKKEAKDQYKTFSKNLKQ